MKNKSFTIRLSPADTYRLEETARMRAEKLEQNSYIKVQESWSDLIRQAILRFYNETFEYYMYEKEDFVIKPNDEVQ